MYLPKKQKINLIQILLKNMDSYDDYGKNKKIIVSKEEHIIKHPDAVIGLNNLEIGRKYGKYNKENGEQFTGYLICIIKVKTDRGTTPAGLFELVGERYRDYTTAYLTDCGVVSYKNNGWNSYNYLVELDSTKEIDLTNRKINKIIQNSNPYDLDYDILKI